MERRRRDALIERAYDAALDAGQWVPFVADLAGELRSVGSLYVHDPRLPRLGFVAEHGIAEATVAAYRARYCACNVVLPRLLALPEMAVATRSDVMADAELEGTEYYADWARPNGLHHSLSSVLLHRPDAEIMLSFFRPHGDPEYGGADRRLLAGLASHVRRAARLSLTLAEAHAAPSPGLEGLDHLGLAAFVVDRHGRVHGLNGEAARLASPTAWAAAGGGSAVRVVLDRLTVAEPRAAERLARAIPLAADGGRGDSVIVRRAGRPPLSMLVVPLARGRGGMAGVTRAVLVLVHDPERRGLPPAAHLARVHGLTPAEGRLLAALAGGARLSDYADEAGLSIHTVKTQLAALFRKTDTARQADLVRLVLSDPLAAALARDEPAATPVTRTSDAPSAGAGRVRP